jgi:hypothetical protein
MESAPQTLRFPASAEFWQPLIFSPRDLAPAARGAQWVQVVARLKDTVSPGQATTALQTVADRLATEFPQTEKDATLLATPLHTRVQRLNHSRRRLISCLRSSLGLPCSRTIGRALSIADRPRELPQRQSAVERRAT